MADAPRETSMLWPDPAAGPWRLRVWWRAQHGVPTPVGMSMTSWIDENEQRASGPHNVLPVGTDDVALPKLDGRLVRRLPVGQVLDTTREQLHDALREHLAGAAEHVEELSRQGKPAHSAVSEARLVTFTEQTQDLRAALDSGRRGRDLGDDHYREVAAIYAQALRDGRSPTKAVQEHYTVEKSTAAKKVARARERGFLPKTTRGRIGSVTEEL
ncbi:MAG: hypothetical protein JWP11_2924 [Frankiales bacterium]|nr:hypothetical protein [Frankiales bacterium]